MSKNQSAKRAEPGKASLAPHHDWLSPVSDATPCGPDLEYDHDFVVLFASAAPKQDVQYGSFVGAPDPVNWSELERDCRRLMIRTKDIRVAVLFARCRARLAGAAGLAEGTGLLAAWLQHFGAHVHPQPDSDGEPDAALEMRMNALQALADPDGLLADVREIVLAKSTLARLQVRDVERAFTYPRPPDALAPESVTQQLQDLQDREPTILLGFGEADANLAAINAWCVTHLESHLPDFSPLTRLLRHLRMSTGPTESEADPLPAFHTVDEGSFDDTDPAQESSPTITALDAIGRSLPPEVALRADRTPADRKAALDLIRSARQWFEINEPSSPIPVLLKRAEQFVGKRYAETVNAIPADLLAQWEQADPV
ncbi:ImpA family type VI secretion system protein [Burkholderia sp. BCC1988]|uniref:type VI secretion system protein TssA n=1 Tax=Burkholderia sp. BCC1988 TaxID=2817443 RepID=UPI002AB2F887|nr:type VI secretion system ImpA family N-terminal domain-containing protein [Burkholderia sp. BCC1988]